MFHQILNTQFPRMLSQACRDYNSPFYGCFDRNWWHYRIRDFASIMLQQGGYTAAQYAKLPDYLEYKDELENLAHASAIFWNERSKKRGAFEEYYPWEQGYPPLAFSTLAMAKLCLEGLVKPEEISIGLKKAAKQIQNRFESQAGNQQVAGLAALSIIRKINPELVKEEKYQSLKLKTLNLQNKEGWYTEYDGPDLGYLSVTLDCLWDLYDATGDSDYLKSAQEALSFLYEFTVRRYGGAGMHNARNTDYIVPYGICRFLDQDDEKLKQKSSFILSTIYEGMEEKTHFFHAIDDRYWSHYIGYSVVRAQHILQKKDQKKKDLINVVKGDITFDESGYIFKSLTVGNTSLLISSNKGGVLSIYDKKESIYSDYGWVVKSGKKQYVNHWWSNKWELKQNEESIEIKGYLFPHTEKTSTPFLHFGLRLVSFFFGSSLTRVLRNVLIFKSKSSKIKFHRAIEIGKDSLSIRDEIEGINKQATVTRAPRASQRPVASADSWHQEDWEMMNGERLEESIESGEGNMVITTRIGLKF